LLKQKLRLNFLEGALAVGGVISYGPFGSRMEVFEWRVLNGSRNGKVFDFLPLPLPLPFTKIDKHLASIHWM
jgi:hypothetical protein